MIEQGKIAGDTRTVLARAGMAIMIRAGASRPDIRTTDALKRTLLASKSIAYAGEGAGGVFFAHLGAATRHRRRPEIEDQDAGLAGEQVPGYAGSALSTKLKVTGVDLFSAGDFSEVDDNDEVVLRDPSRGIYKRVVLRDNKVVGAVLYGDTADGSWYFDLLKKGADVAELRDTLIFGQAYQGGGVLDPVAAVAALSDDAEICGCNGVCKGVITRAIAAKGLTTLDDVRVQTKASASCGQCTSKVEALLASALGDAYAAAARKPMCKCIDLTHEEVRG